jgi:hypothetical protein
MLVFQMLGIKHVVLCLTLVLGGSINAQAKDWRGIVPLHSSRVDVERLLGPPTTDRSDIVFYDYDAERVSIEYSRGPCAVELSEWNVSPNTVISIWVTPMTNQLSAADLNLGHSKYKKLRDEHVGNIVHYIDEEDGIEYNVDETNGMVGLVKYLPSASDKNLLCPESPNRLRETVKFDEYSGISFAAEKKRLDKFALQLIRYSLKNYASAEGHILAYGGKRARIDEANARAKRAKDYLVKILDINPKRIETRDGGYRERPTIELFLVPPGGQAPLSRPTVDAKDVQIIKRHYPHLQQSGGRRSARPRSRALLDQYIELHPGANRGSGDL